MNIESINSTLLDEKIYFKQLESGIKAYILPKSGFAKQFAVFATHYGSIDNAFKKSGDSEYTVVPDGIAHFLEHKLFEQKEGNIFEKFSKLGSSPNAYTNYTTTAYLFLSTQNFFESFSLLLDFVQDPYLTDENVEKEKGIIEQEIKMYDDNANAKVFYNLMKCLYKNNPVNIDIAGTVESIHKINTDTLYNCYNTFYTPSNMMVFAAGDIDYNKFFDIIDNTVIKRSKQNIERFKPEEPKAVAKPFMESKLSLSSPLFNLGFKHNTVGLKGKELLKNIICNNLILDIILGRSSECFNEMYSQGLINDSFATEYVGDERYSFTIIGGETKEPEQVKERILQEIIKNKNQELDKLSFERIKKMHLGKFIKQFDSIESISHTFTNYIFNDIMLFDYIDVINLINYNDIMSRFRESFNTDEMAFSLITPI